MAVWEVNRATNTITYDITRESCDFCKKPIGDVVCDGMIHVFTCWRCLPVCKECTKRYCPCHAADETEGESGTMLCTECWHATHVICRECEGEFSEDEMAEDTLCKECITTQSSEGDDNE